MKFVNSDYPWFLRGASYHIGSDTGVFAFGNNYGSGWPYISFRVYTMILLL